MTDTLDLRRYADPARLDRLGFGAADAAGLRRLIDASDAELVREVGAAADRLRAGIAWFENDAVGAGPSADLEPDPAAPPVAHRPSSRAQDIELLALLVAVPDVVAYHRGRGITEDVSWATLADLGQQVAVHRATFGTFGLHTHRWLRVAWSGALYALGRLQFELRRRAEGARIDQSRAEGARTNEARTSDWWLSVHIPETGPLRPGDVEDSFARARAFFARHFAEFEFRGFHCGSWLLDPQLAGWLAPDSNIVAFQRRWRIEPGARPGNADAIFFVFRRRGEVDLDVLPRDTSLQRAVADHRRAGGDWQIRDGIIEP